MRGVEVERAGRERTVDVKPGKRKERIRCRQNLSLSDDVSCLSARQT